MNYRSTVSVDRVAARRSMLSCKGEVDRGTTKGRIARVVLEGISNGDSGEVIRAQLDIIQHETGTKATNMRLMLFGVLMSHVECNVVLDATELASAFDQDTRDEMLLRKRMERIEELATSIYSANAWTSTTFAARELASIMAAELAYANAS